jgi:hypothetical protein
VPCVAHRSPTCVLTWAPLCEGRRADEDSQGGGEMGSRLLSTLLTEMDGMELATGVLVRPPSAALTYCTAVLLVWTPWGVL